MNFIAAAEIAAANLAYETAGQEAADGVLLEKLFGEVEPSGVLDMNVVAKLPKAEKAEALNAISRQTAALAKVILNTEYGDQDVNEVLTSL